MENDYESMWKDYLSETEGIEGEEEIREEVQIKTTEETSVEKNANEIINRAFNKLNDVNLKEEELEKIAQKISLIEDDFAKGEILVKVVKHPRASMGVIEEAKLYVSKIKSKSTQKNT